MKILSPDQTTMADQSKNQSEFLSQLTELVEENISNEQFGVSELADAVGMSRSNLLRKIKKETNLSASQFIREVRLENALDLLKDEDITVSEVSYKVGFGSPSYFIKCFREKYGYSPGESSKHEKASFPKESKKKPFPVLLITVLSVVLMAAVLFVVLKPKQKLQRAKSIAVLPFINDSNDSSNIYIINGLMEATLNNLQKIEDLRVISRTSVEQFRNKPLSTPEIAKKLNAKYLVEGSGQKIGDQILLTIQLIEAESDDHLWSHQYQRKTEDIFALQATVAKDIAKQIKAIITPEENERIEQVPTENLVAYDFFLKGLDLLSTQEEVQLRQAIDFFHKAISEDPKFARAYAGIGIAYYLLDEGKTQMFYRDSLNYYADQALLHDAQLPQSIIAKGLYYLSNKEYKLAVTYFEKVLEIHPGNDLVLVFLLDVYAHRLPNTEKYLEYALKGLEVDVVAAYDSATASYNYLHLSNAFIQSGFIDEAEKYIDLSLEMLPENIYAQYVKAFITYANDRDLIKLKDALELVLQKDPTRLDVMQELAKIYYYLRDFENSYKHYKIFVERREQYGLSIYEFENLKIAYVFEKMGESEKARQLTEKYVSIAESTQSIYKHASLAFYYTYSNNKEKALYHFGEFYKEDNYFYWIFVFTKMEPVMANLIGDPEFEQIYAKLETKFQNYHERIANSLKEKGLL